MLVRTILQLHVDLAMATTGEHVRTDWKLSKAPPKQRKKVRAGIGQEFSDAALEKAKGTWLEGPVRCAIFLGL